MTLHLYNTFTRQKQPFAPLNPNHVRMYVCGPTVYDRAHIGNARPVAVFDVLFRLLQQLYPRVTYARNITDIDDKIITAAEQKHIPIEKLTTQTTQFYHEDMAALNALSPTIEPKATEHIPQMVHMIQQLIASNHAYVVEGHVLFQVKTDPSYGKLSKLNADDRIAGARVEVAPYKKDPQDFVLWKPSAPHQPGWESPWGRGRPGWHIECSAMADTYLETPFDIHGGGIDLIFPHHENEIAQTCCALNVPTMAQVWMHNGHLVVNGEKMSKSLGNFLTVNDLLAHTPGEVIRLALLSAHYRQPLNWTTTLVTQTKNVLNKFYKALAGFEESAHPVAGKATHPWDAETATLSPSVHKIFAALLDDLNTPLALTHFHDVVKEIQACSDAAQKTHLQAQLKAAGSFVGILNHRSTEWFECTEGVDQLLEVAEIERCLQERTQAKQEKNFQKADEIRAFLEDNGVGVEDTPRGPVWRYK